MQILMKSNLSTMSKENVLAKVDIDNVSELHINVKKTLRDLKSLSEPEIVKPGKEVKTDKNSSRVEVKQKSSQRMEDDSSLERFSKGIKNVPEGWKMRNKEKDLQGFQKMSIEKGIIP